MEKKEEKILTGYKIRKDLSINLEIGKPLKNLNKSQFFFYILLNYTFIMTISQKSLKVLEFLIILYISSSSGKRLPERNKK